MALQDLCTYQDVYALVGELVADQWDSTALQALCAGDTDTQGLIERFSRYLEAQTQVEFHQRTETHYMSGKGTNMVLLPEHVQTPIASLALEYQQVGAGWTQLTAYDYTDSGIVRLTGTENRAFSSRSDLPRFVVGVNNVKATVTFGYATPPPDIRSATAYLCGIEILRRYTRATTKGLKSRMLGDRREDYGVRGQFSEDIDLWQRFIDETIANWLGGVASSQASRAG